MDIRIAMAGLAHNHGMSFIRSAVKKEGVRFVGFFDDDFPEKARAAAEEFSAPYYEDYNELLYNAGANMLLTAAVNSKRPGLIVKALDAGLNVATDKPFATTFEDLDEIEEALERNLDGKLYVMLTERFSEELYTAKKLIGSGEIGALTNQILMRPHRLSPKGRGAWMFDSRHYGGIINDIGIHDFDIAAWISGNEVDEVLSATVRNTRFHAYTDFYDYGDAHIKMKNGSTAFIVVNWLTPDAYPFHGEVKFIISGTNGQIYIDPQKKLVTVYNDEKPPYDAEILSPGVSCVEDMLKCFSEKNYRPAVTSGDALRAQRAAMTAQKIAENRI